MINRHINLNGVSRVILADPETSLAEVIRGQLGLTGAKVGCGQSQCGACSVILDGKLVKSCMTKIKRLKEGSSVTTIEGLGTPDNLHALQLAWAVHGGAQCGFCSPGFIVSAKALLDTNTNPTRKKSGTASTGIATPVAARATNLLLMLSWMRPRYCVER